MLLMHGAFLVPPNRREGPGPASSSLPGRGGAARLPQCRWERERALGGPGLGKGSPSQQMPAPTSLAETQSHGLPWEEPGDVCFWPPQSLGGKETGKVGSGQQRELVRRKHGAERASRVGQWMGQPAFPCNSPRWAGKASVKRDPRGGAPRGGRGLEVVCGGQ